MALLIVDSEAFTARATRRTALDVGYDCEIASSAIEAMRFLMFRDPDFVLTDLDLEGERRGLDLLLWMRTAGFAVPAAVMTRGEEEQAREILDETGLGDVEVLTTPIRPAELREVLALCALSRRDSAGWPVPPRRANR